ncbi:MAG: SatD family protein [Pseudomonadota bacterium]
MTSQAPVCAILMGDLVNSEAFEDTAGLHAAFNAAVARQNAAPRPALLSPLTITLGDEFQGLYRALGPATLAARDMRFDLLDRGIDCRFVIGSVRIDTPINPNRAWNMMGPGLSEARDLLNEKTAGLTYRFSLPDQPGTAQLLNALGAGLSVIERSWTATQRRDIRALLDGATPEALAKTRDVSLRAIYKSRKGGEYDAYLYQWTAVLDALAARDRSA